jgi:uracil phosphoribosyltransferase
MAEFRTAANQLAILLAQETAEYLPVTPMSVTTPLSVSFTGMTQVTPLVLIPILRSGLALLPAFAAQYPHAKIGVFGLKRDEKTAIAHWYYKNMPKIDAHDHIILLDPMIATGGSALAALNELSQMGIGQERITFVGVISATPGIEAIRTVYPHLRIITAANDPALNTTKYIVPGLGDFGDRYFGTL